VLAGRDYGGYGDNVLRPLARSLGCEDQVEFTGYISDEDVRALYAAARCVAQVSEGEGFGLPVIEAMFCGAPVIAANTTALKEVAGDAALLVDPMDEQKIATGLAQLCGDEHLRRDLRERGIRHTQQYTWDRAAQQTIAVYQLTAGAMSR
jgi:glycosyltransferase involved in cell wall biosynthesis